MPGNSFESFGIMKYCKMSHYRATESERKLLNILPSVLYGLEKREIAEAQMSLRCWQITDQASEGRSLVLPRIYLSYCSFVVAMMSLNLCWRSSAK